MLTFVLTALAAGAGVLVGAYIVGCYIVYTIFKR